MRIRKKVSRCEIIHSTAHKNYQVIEFGLYEMLIKREQKISYATNNLKMFFFSWKIKIYFK